MIHIATVHWNTAKWIAPQQEYLRRHLRAPFRVYAWLNNIPDAPREAFYYVRSEAVESHAAKLNQLAETILASAGSDDILIFLDGDAFPIGDVEALLEQNLSTRKLVAVQRLENDGDPQPHPSFCATTAGFWREIEGDWNAGYIWKNKRRQPVTDIGGNLLQKLTQLGIPWLPLLRSNKLDLHPLFFGIYGDVIYHHGAGFRQGECRIDMANLQLRLRDQIFAEVLPGYRSWVRRKAYRQVVARNDRLSEQVYESIGHDPEFFRQFM